MREVAPETGNMEQDDEIMQFCSNLITAVKYCS